MGNFFCGNQNQASLQMMDYYSPNVLISQSGRPIGINYDNCKNFIKKQLSTSDFKKAEAAEKEK